MFLITASLVVGGGIVFGSLSAQKTPTEGAYQTTHSPDPATIAATHNIQEDSDNDGLKNWEEELFNTDPNRPDTDGDGTSDGEEVRAKRNPTIPGPDDAQQPATNKTQRIAPDLSDDTKKISLTDLFFQSAFVNMAAGQTDSISESDAQAMLQETIQNASIDALTSRVYTKKDIPHIIPTSKQSVQNYGNELGRITQQYQRLGERKELQIVQSELEEMALSQKPQQSYPDIDGLEPIAADYKSLISEYQNIPVPTDAVAIHVRILTIEQSLHDAINSMKSIASDPMGGIFALQQYQDALTETQTIIQDLRSYFNAHEVTFSPSDPGYVFF